MKTTRNRKGMAIVIVLIFCITMLTLGSFYLRRFGQSRPINERMLERVQADFLGYGILQIALLKYKQLPAEFYFAYNAIVRGGRSLTPDPWQTYTGGPLRGNIASPFTASYTTVFTILGQNPFNADSLVVAVTVDSSGVVRTVNHTVNAVRVRN